MTKEDTYLLWNESLEMLIKTIDSAKKTVEKLIKELDDIKDQIVIASATITSMLAVVEGNVKDEK